MANPKDDPVNHPAHYMAHPSGVECIQVTEHMNFCLGNAVKYLWRAGQKDSAPQIEDLKKARWYIDREISRIEKSQQSQVLTNEPADQVQNFRCVQCGAAYIAHQDGSLHCSCQTKPIEKPAESQSNTHPVKGAKAPARPIMEDFIETFMREYYPSCLVPDLSPYTYEAVLEIYLWANSPATRALPAIVRAWPCGELSDAAKALIRLVKAGLPPEQSQP